MDRSIARHSRFVLATLVVVLLAAAVPLLLPRGAAASAVTVEPAAKAAATESVLVVRRAVDHDALWLLSPVDGTPTAAGDLPGFAGSVAVSPDGQNVAYLPENIAPRVWIGYGPLGPKSISLDERGREARRLILLDRRRPAAGRRRDEPARAVAPRPSVRGERRDRQGTVVPGSVRRRAELRPGRRQGRLREVHDRDSRDDGERLLRPPSARVSSC